MLESDWWTVVVVDISISGTDGSKSGLSVFVTIVSGILRGGSSGRLHLFLPLDRENSEVNNSLKKYIVADYKIT